MWAKGAILGLATMVLAISPANATPITYDCDTPADNFSELVLPQTAPFRISGRLQLVVLAQSSRFVGMGRIAVASTTESPSSPRRWAGFTLTNMAGSRELPTGLLGTELVAPATEPVRNVLGRASSRDIAFALSFDGTSLSGTIDGHEVRMPFQAESYAVKFNCSTGEFLFSDIEITPLTPR